MLIVDPIGIEVFQHVTEKLPEIWVNMDTMRAFLREAGASIDDCGMTPTS